MVFPWKVAGILPVVVLLLLQTAAGQDASSTFQLPMRTRVEPFKGSGEWREMRFEKELKVRGTAIVICDMWDRHWCSGAERRADLLAPRIDQVIRKARERGILIVHAPSDTISFYRDYPQRQRMAMLTRLAPPPNRELADPPLPIDDSDNGCDTGEKPGRPWPWTRQHAAISITPQDVLSDQGIEIYSLLSERGIRLLLMMGVHTNMCILNRSFAIKQMTRWGIGCILVRDLTDSMYNPKMPPYVSHDEGTELVVQHIEKHWGPTTTSEELLRALAAR